MTALKKQAMTMVESIPDEKMSHVVDMLRSITDIIGNDVAYPPRREAWKQLQKYKGIIAHDINEKAELAEARNEKYADFI